MRSISNAQISALVRPRFLIANCHQFRFLALVLIMFAAYLPSSGLWAQIISEEYLLVKNYKLPEGAVQFSALKESPGSTELTVKPMLYKDKLFSGLSFEQYETKALSRVQTYKNGILDGPSYVWYPDGKPQMYVNYRQGVLSGRFLGWYIHGGIIYDMVINNQGFAGDYIEDGRSGEAGIEEEGEGDALTNDKE